MSDSRTSITRILLDSPSGDQAAERLLPLIYDELRRMAAGLLSHERKGHTLRATALVHEAYLRLFDQEHLRWNNRKHFFGAAAKAMRRILVDHARRKLAGKRIPSDRITPIELSAEPAAPAATAVDVIELHEALEGLAKLDARQAQIVELRYFAGLSEPEVAEVLEVSRATVARDWRAARRWLLRELS